MPVAIKKKGRKEIKNPDEFLTFSQRLMLYIRTHKRLIYGVITGVILAAALYSAGWAYWGYVNKKALLIYGAATSRFNSVAFDEEKAKSEKDSLVKIFQDVYQKYPLSKASKLIYPFLAYIDFGARELDKAVSELETFSNKMKDHQTFYVLSQVATSKCLEEKGDLAGALKALENLGLNDSDPISALVQCQKTRLLYLMAKAKKEDKALKEAKEAFLVLKEKWPEYPLVPIIEATLSQQVKL